MAKSPLKLLTPRNHGHAAWGYVTNYGGGFVDGDRLKMRVAVEEGASALFTTPSQAKVYRSANGCSLDLETRIDDDAFAALVPDPVSCFAGARYEQTTDVHLGARASLLYLDGLTCGRRARGEKWALSRYASRLRVHREGATVLHDATVLDAAHGDLEARMQRFEAMATIVALGPHAASIVRALLEATDFARRADVVSSASPLGGDGAIVRLAASAVEPLLLATRHALRLLPDVLGDDPFARKW